MTIVIIEDEELTAQDLADTVAKAEPGCEVIAILHSVKEAVTYFGKNDDPDLIFSDIQLGDGLSFEIFKKATITAPIIFCTAYDEYALRAFKTNGIDYVLKPFTKKTISEALRRYKDLKERFSKSSPDYKVIAELLQKRNKADTSVLVYYKDKILPVKTNDIALFHIDRDIMHLVTFDLKSYTISKTMEEIERIAGNNFFRVSRAVLIHRKAIKDASQYFHRKLLISLNIPFVPKEPITVSKLRVADFLNWLAGA